MADNIAVTPGSGATVAADDIGAGVLAQRVKPVWGPDGTGNDVDIASGKPLPTQARGSDGTDRSLAGMPFFTQTTATSGTTAYAIGDVVGGALDLGVLGPSGGIVEIISASLQINTATLISGQGSYRLWLYNVTPSSAIADSSPWDFATADQTQCLGYIDLGTVIDQGNTLYVQQDNIGHRCKLSGTHLFAYLVTNGAYTPTAQSHIISLHVEPK